MFCTHPNVAWLSGYHARYLSRIETIKYLTYLGDIPILGAYLRGFIEPGECYELWDQICTGFSTPIRDLKAEDVTNKKRKKIQETFSRIVTKKKYRPLVKLTGWPRIGFLNEIYPDAKFIHIMRDGRAVSNSILHVDFWWGWRGPQNWRWGELSSEDREEWNNHDQSFVALAGIQWKILMDSMEKAKGCADSSNFMEIKYETFCQESIDIFKNVTEFCELDWSKSFEKNLSKFKLNSQDYKWKNELSEKQISELENVLRQHLERYGYVR
jgi:hypothetical protein